MLRCIVFIFLFLATQMKGQQELNSFLINDLYQSSYLNPAYTQNTKWVVALPSWYGMLHQRGFSVGSLIKGQVSGSLLTNRNQVLTGSDISLFSVGYQRKKWNYRLSQKYKLHTDIQSNAPLIELLLGGNSSIVGGQINASPYLNTISYGETSVGVSYILDRNLTIGANVKFLNGIQNISTEQSDFTLSVDSEIYQLRLEGDIAVNSSFPISLDNFSSARLFATHIIPRNFGMAIDLGVNGKMGDWEYAASIMDLGFLRWTDQVNNYKIQGTFLYEGVSLDELIENDFNLLDTLGASVDIDNAKQPYQKFVPAKFYGGLTYHYLDRWDLSGMIYAHRSNATTNAAFALNATRTFADRHALGIHYSVIGNNPLNLGVSGFSTLGPFQIYGIFDNIIGLFNNYNAENVNLRAGINIVFPVRKKQEMIRA